MRRSWASALGRDCLSDFGVVWVFLLETPGLVSFGCSNKLPQTWHLQTTDVYSHHSILEARSPKSRCWPGPAPCEGCGEQSFLASTGCWWLLAFLGLWWPRSSLSLFPYFCTTFSVCSLLFLEGHWSLNLGHTQIWYNLTLTNCICKFYVSK